MPIRVEAYTLGGIVTGVVTRPDHLRDLLENSTEIELDEGSEAPLDGSAIRSGQLQLAIDDVVIAVGDEELQGPVHAAWHPITLEAGPWLVHGDLPTLPGFDPGRALTRPTGTFVLLRDVRVSLIGNREAGENIHANALVNRYSVDRIDAELMLGFFFPGAHVETAAQPAAPAVAQPPAASPETTEFPAESSATA